MQSHKTTGKRKRLSIARKDEHDTPSCTICIQPYIRRTFLQPCYHSFCFQCIRQWINIAPNCPLCKQRIDSLVYNVDEEKNTFQEYVLADNEQHDPSPEAPARTLHDRILPLRTHVYHTRHFASIAYPPPLRRFEPLQYLTPEHMPKASTFIAREIPAIMGRAADALTERHVKAVLLTPYETNQQRKRSRMMTMHDPQVIDELAEWLTIGVKELDGPRVARRFINELMAYIKSGMDYWTYVAAVEHREDETDRQIDGKG